MLLSQLKDVYIFSLTGAGGLCKWGSLLAGGVAIRLVIFAFQVYAFHRSHHLTNYGTVPPKYPTLIPYLGVVLPLLWDTRSALTRLTKYRGEASVARLSVLPGFSVFFYQSPEVIRKIWKESTLLDFRPMATHFFRTACGMPPKDAAMYMTDNTGYKARALPGTNVPEEQRVYRLIHESDRQGLAGRGLAPTLQRYMDALDTRLSTYLSDDWVQLTDFWEFVQETVGGSMLEALFGKELQRLHPDFVHSFFEFDRQAPSLIKMTPFSGTEKIRNEVLAKYKTWFANARRNFTKEAIYPDGDGDPYWGCGWTRFRHDSFRPFFSEEALASSDLGVAWGALGNTTPCAMMAVAHAVQDKTLHARLRDEVDKLCNGKPLPAVNQKSFTNHTLLSAMYAETLRLYITVFIPVVPLHGELDLGKWRVPQSSMGMINAAIAHRNEDVWNTKDGLHPVDTFWAERFIIDPQDATSGPFRSGCRDRCANSRGEQVDVKAPGGGEPYFSLRGLEGSWIPYGGGQNMCPGRFLAKGVITYMLAYMVREFDLELPDEPIPLGTDRFGMGAELPTRPIPFRIRRKMAVGATTVT